MKYIENNDSNQFIWNIIDNFLDEYEKAKPGDENVLVQRTTDNKMTYITPDGLPLCSEWFDYANPFSEGFSVVENRNPKTNVVEYNYLSLDGKFLREKPFNYAADFHDGWGSISDKDDHNLQFINAKGKYLKVPGEHFGTSSFDSGRAIVFGTGRNYHFIDTKGKRVSNLEYRIPDPLAHAQLPYKDGYAIAKSETHGGARLLIDVNENPIPQQDRDSLIINGNLGYGYYITGTPEKRNGYKLKDANTGQTIDYYQDIRPQNETSIHRQIQYKIVEKMGKDLPVDYKNEEDQKDNGILFVGDYWFLGPSNIKVGHDGKKFISYSPYGTYYTLYTPIKAIDKDHIFCAHDNQILLFDQNHKRYYKCPSAKELKEHVKRREERRILERLNYDIKTIRKLPPLGYDLTLVLNEKELEVCDTLNGKLRFGGEVEQRTISRK